METATACPTSTATILACQKIAKSFKENIYELSSIRNEWDPEYAISLNVWINDTIEKYYAESFDSIKDEKYREWHEVLVAGLQSLKVLRAALKVDFKKDKPFVKEVFKKLGYNDYFSDAKNGDHLSLYKFLVTFAENLDEDTRKKISDKGVPDSLFHKILETARQIEDFKCCFEALESENELNTFAQKDVIEIYEIVQDICRLAAAYYQFDPIKRDEFNFYKVMVNL
ncbi:hypothetical protein D1164_04045 [Mariniphaga sediminis]|jgi:hypothetical protein|uniref:Uncharacterized protein n=1 Tax=Mariniphaga sediminis TaxID=1628158 RepID=A0A399D5S5_9BACT|nr:hypothetical protein [Mariniphaga sediminis]RIH66773.1 hypothetical protein D1164_04045 [Mariniphaga sediminis]